MKVARYNYAHQLGPNIEPLIADLKAMLVEGRYELTTEVKQFEAQLAQYLGASHVRGVNTGTDALIVAMRALGVGPGDEVITQANTFHATVGAIELVGATPVLVDAEPDSFLMDRSQLHGAITPRTRALIPVHLYGKPTPMAELMALAEAKGLFVVEDAAQAIGARIEGQAVSTFGHFGCFSFHPSKNLCAAGDGGAVVARNAQLDEALRRQRELGQVGQNNHVVVGLNSKLDAMQARILSWKLPRLEEWNEHRRLCARLYRERLADLPLQFQATTEGEVHVYHLFQVRTPSRDALLAHLREGGVDSTIRYPTPIHLQPAFAKYGWKEGQFPVAEALARELLTLPVRPDLSVEEIDYVCDCIHAFFREHGEAR
ncbi:MAG: DegT/DnrJ/EryC1/StrS family aminotransferase [Myxococcaceae bacterium]